MFEHVNDEELLSALRRFMRKIEDHSSDDICWVWKATRTWPGYGQFWFRGKAWLAHRWSYWLKYEKLTDRLEIDHRCKNRACVNPLHLREVDRPTNILSGNHNGHLTHCRHGHEFTEENTYYYKEIGRGIKRKCKMCDRLRHAATK